MSADSVVIEGIFLLTETGRLPCPVIIAAPVAMARGGFSAMVSIPRLLPDPVEIAGANPGHALRIAGRFAEGFLARCRARRDGRLVDAQGRAVLPAIIAEDRLAPLEA